MRAEDENKLDLDALAALEQAANSGPWEFRPRRGFQSTGHNPSTIGFNDTAGYFVMLREGTWVTESDMELVVALRNAAPALIAAARERDEFDETIGDLVAQRNISAEAERERTAERDEFIQAACDRRSEAVRYLGERDAARAEVAALRERVEAVLTWGNGRDAGGVDRLIPAADLRAALTTRGDQ